MEILAFLNAYQAYIYLLLKNLIIIKFYKLILYFWNTILAMGKSLKIFTLIPVSLLNNASASCSLIIFSRFFLHYSSVFSLNKFWIFTFCTSFTPQPMGWHCFIYSLNFYLSLEILISFFMSSNSSGQLFIKSNSLWLIFESIKALEIKILRYWI